MERQRRYYTAEEKHRILLEYHSNVRGRGFASLAKRFGIQGGKAVIYRWYQQWRQDISSLQTRKRSGRRRVLTPAEVTAYITTPLKRKNRKSTAIHYTDIHTSIKQRTGKEVSIQSVRRYGHRDLKAKEKKCQKRTSRECKYSHQHI
jgi:transposase-like protein